MWTETNTKQDLIAGILNHGPEILENCICHEDLTDYITRIENEKLQYPIPPKYVDTTNWCIPQEYKSLDIEKYLIEICPKDNQDRLTQEMTLYKKYNMISLLKTVKYIVDTLRKNEIVWGVGRGSSVASYALFLLGVHKIDSVKYNLPLEEFFKEI